MALLCAVTLCISCNKPEREIKPQETITRQSSPATNEEPAKSSLAQEVEKFFREFSIALGQNDATKASGMIAKEKRARFERGFQFWQGVEFFEPLIIKVSEDRTLIEVEVSFKTGTGKQDRETKKLTLRNGKWVMLDS